MRQFALNPVTANTVAQNYSGTTGTTNSVINNAGISFVAGAGNIAADITGKIKITTGGTYTFYSNSDDSSRVYIDGNLLINNDGGTGGRANTEYSNTVSLGAGLHDLHVEYINTGGSGGTTPKF